jgi:transposase
VGGSVWFGDETTLREFPPLRSAWARCGEQAVVMISGKNSRRVVHGALNPITGQVVRVVRARSRGADCGAFVDALAQRCDPERPHLLVWDNAPPHWTHAARDAAPANLTIAWLPFRSPELMPCEDIWREMKRTVAANRAYADVDELAQRALAWLDDLAPADLLRLSGVQSSKFHWLPT